MNQTTLLKQAARRFLTALTEQDVAEVNHLLWQDVCLQIRGDGRMESYWTRARVQKALLAEFARGTEPHLTILDVTVANETVLVAFQLQMVMNGNSIKYDRSITLTFHKGQVEMILLYCYDEMVQARLQRWFVPVQLVDVLVADIGLRRQDIREKPCHD